MKIKSYVSKNTASAAFWTMLIVLTGCLPGAWAQPTVTTTNLPAYESFATTYTDGEQLGQFTSGTNWPTGNSVGGSSATIRQAAALSYPSLLTEATNTSRGLKSGTGTGKVRNFFFNPAVNTNANTILYASFLFSLQTTNPTGSRVFTGLSSGSGSSPTLDAAVYIDTANHLLVGKNSSTAALPVSPTTYSLVPSNTYLVVLSYKFNAGSSTNDVVSLWVNPTSLGNNASVPSPSITTSNGSDTTTTLKTFNYLAPSSGLSNVVAFYMDEIRIGTNWADVTPTNSIAGNAYTVGGGGSGCPGDFFPINLSGSDLGVSYLLYTNGVYSGISSNGTGSAFSYAPQSSAAVYTVLATNNSTAGVSWMPGSATISISSAPNINAQPASVLAATNSTVVFSVTSAGTGLGYRWYRNGSPLSDVGHVTGSGTSALTIYPVTSADAATTANGYYCIITNPCGSQVISTTNALTIQVANNLVWQGTPTNLWDIATTASWTNNAGSAVVFNPGDNVTLDDTAANTTLLLNSPYLSPGTITFNGSGSMAMGGSGNISGTASSLLAIGSGTLTISNANSFAGGTAINNGTVVIGNATSLGSGTVTLAGGTLNPTASLSVVPNNLNVTASSTLTGGNISPQFGGTLTGGSGVTLTVNGTAATFTPRLYGTNFTFNGNINLFTANTSLRIYNASGTQIYNGNITGPGNLNRRSGTAGVSGDAIFNNGTSDYSGGIMLSDGGIGFGVSSTGNPVTTGPIGSGTLTIQDVVNTSKRLYASGGAQVVANAITWQSTQDVIINGANNLTLAGNIDLNATNHTVEVDNTANTFLSGSISDGGLSKTGNGALYLDGNNSYAGPTTNSAGLLAGAGTIAAPVVIGTGGLLGGGSAAAIGTLTINNSLTLNGGAFIRVNKSLSPAQSNDVVNVTVTGGLTNLGTGTLTVTNLGPALAVGDKFQFFSQGVTNGNAMTVIGSGVTWTNKLAVDGSIAVLSTTSLANYSTNISFSVTGNTLTISWPSTHLGWILQSQTNSLSVGLRTNWVNMAGSASITSTNITINPANPVMFFRLSHP